MVDKKSDGYQTVSKFFELNSNLKLLKNMSVKIGVIYNGL